MGSFSFSFLKKSIPGEKSSSEPPMARFTATAPAYPTNALLGSRYPTLPSYSGFSRSAHDVGTAAPPSASTFTNRPSVP